MHCRPITAVDLPEVAQWNRQLQEDEGAKPMLPEEIHARLSKWLSTDYDGVIFQTDDEDVGYALFRPTDPDLKGPGGTYIRQFFIARDRRGMGFGRQAFDLLQSEVLPGGHRIVLEALTSNPDGRRFWLALGFTEHSITYQYGAGT